MLRPMKPINVKIMYHQKKQHLQRHRPGANKMQRRQMPALIYRRNDIIENKDLQEIALDKSVPDQVYPKSVPEYWHTLFIGKFPLQPDKDKYTQQQDTGSIIYDRLHQIQLIGRAFHVISPRRRQFYVGHAPHSGHNPPPLNSRRSTISP